MTEDMLYPEEIKAANDERLINKVKATAKKYKPGDVEQRSNSVPISGFFSDKCEIKWPKKDKE